MRGIWQPDEGYYVGGAMNMLRTGDLLIPRLGEDNREIFLDKPPGVYWGIIAGLKLFGQNEFGARWFGGLSYLLTILTVGLLGKAMYKDSNKALLASLIYATMIVPFVAANFVTPDTLLSLWTTLSALFFWNSINAKGRSAVIWQLLLYTAIGLGFLTKGPAVFIPCGAIMVFLALRKNSIRHFLSSWLVLGFLVFAVVGLSWYAFVAYRVPHALTYFLDNEVWGRLVSAKYHRNAGLKGAFIYVPVVVFGSLPWAIILWEKVAMLPATLFSSKWWTQLPQKPVHLFLTCWIVVPLLVLSFASSRLGLYALPVFSALAIIFADMWAEKIDLFSLAQLRYNPAMFRRPAAVIAIVVAGLLLARVAIAYYPIHKDTRALWSEIHSYTPSNEAYEIITINEHADGLLFYGAREVENVTVDGKSYPTFSMPETFNKELKIAKTEKETLLVLLRNFNDVNSVKSLLHDSGTDFTEVLLSFNRALLLIKPTDKGDVRL